METVGQSSARQTNTVDALLGRGASERPQAPEPTLLPHLARAAPVDTLDHLCHLAEMFGGGQCVPQVPWTALADAVFFGIASRGLSVSELRPLAQQHPGIITFVPDECLQDFTQFALDETARDHQMPAVVRLARLAARQANSLGGKARQRAMLLANGLDEHDQSSTLPWLALAAPESERAPLIERLSELPRIDAGALAALFPALETSDQLRLAARARQLLEESGIPEFCLAHQAYLLPVARGDARSLLKEGLQLAVSRFVDLKCDLPDWFVALIVARLEWQEDPDIPEVVRPIRDAMSEAWQAHLKRIFSGTPVNLPFHDVLLAHPGSDYLYETDSVSGLADAAASAMDAVIDQWGGAGPPASPPRTAEPMHTTAARAIRGAIGTLMRGLRSKSGSAPPSGADEDAAEPQEPRRLQADVEVKDTKSGYRKLVKGFIAGQDHRVHISVGREGRIRTKGGEGFIEPEFAEGEDFLQLPVYFIHRNAAQSGKIMLPRDISAESTSCSFNFHVPDGSGAEEAIVVVLHKGRILEAAQLRGTVFADADAENYALEAFEFITIAWLHELANLTSRSDFDSSVLALDEIGAAAFSGSKVGVGDLAGVRQSADRIAERLFGASETIFTTGAGLDSDEASALLRFLANQGKALHSALVTQLMPQLDDAKRIQIVTTNASSYLPLEFVYDGPTPRDDARLCANWREALAAGHCEKCEQRPAGGGRVSEICPLDFWGLSKVIERHAVLRDREEEFSFMVTSQTASDRAPIRPFGRILFGASDEVSEESISETLDALTAIEKETEEAMSWDEWREKVKAAPSMLVAMPHNVLHPDVEVLELRLSKGHGLRVGEIEDGGYVRPESFDASEPGPIVVLLGCKTATAQQHPFLTFVGAFRISGAAVVIGTFATVLAEESPHIVRALIKTMADHLQHAHGQGEQALTIGDVLLKVRRDMFASGFVIALAVAAFGDADWLLSS